MKKILIGIATMMLAITSNAAMAEWSAEGIYEYATGEKASDSYLIYAFDNSALAYSDAVSEFTKGDFSNITKGVIADEVDGGEAVGIIDGYVNGGAVNAYLVVFDATTLTDATHVYFSDIVADVTGASGQSAYPGFDMSTSADVANWASITAGGTTPGGDVPEPTSGLLILLGMAGLALKRKRA